MLVFNKKNNVYSYLTMQNLEKICWFKKIYVIAI